MKNITQQLKGIVLGIIIVAGTSIAFAQFTGPSTTPPGGNVPAPLNAGAGAQTKTGALTLGTTGNTNPVLTILGRLGVNTTTPAAEVDVDGVLWANGIGGSTINVTGNATFGSNSASQLTARRVQSWHLAAYQPGDTIYSPRGVKPVCANDDGVLVMCPEAGAPAIGDFNAVFTDLTFFSTPTKDKNSHSTASNNKDMTVWAGFSLASSGVTGAGAKAVLQSPSVPVQLTWNVESGSVCTASATPAHPQWTGQVNPGDTSRSLTLTTFGTHTFSLSCTKNGSTPTVQNSQVVLKGAAWWNYAAQGTTTAFIEAPLNTGASAYDIQILGGGGGGSTDVYTFCTTSPGSLGKGGDGSPTYVYEASISGGTLSYGALVGQAAGGPGKTVSPYPIQGPACNGTNPAILGNIVTANGMSAAQWMGGPAGSQRSGSACSSATPAGLPGTGGAGACRTITGSTYWGVGGAMTGDSNGRNFTVANRTIHSGRILALRNQPITTGILQNLGAGAGGVGATIAGPSYPATNGAAGGALVIFK